MPDLNDFYGDEVAAGRVIGTYIYPYCLLSMPDWEDPFSATEVIQRVNITNEEILITRNGGLFIKPPEELSDINRPDADPGQDLQAKLEFEERAAKLFNLVICEYAFHEVISEPTTPVHISTGKLIDDHALIISASGARELYLERTLNPSMNLLQGTWRMHRIHDPQVTSSVANLASSSKLSDISENLPALTAGAYSLFSRRQLSEALIDAWIVSEQIVDWQWDDYLSQLSDSERRRRLCDTRTYTASIRIEILHTVGVFNNDLYTDLTKARKHRNDLAHRAKINIDMATETLMAMKYAIDFLCGTQIATPLTSTGVNW